MARKVWGAVTPTEKAAIRARHQRKDLERHTDEVSATFDDRIFDFSENPDIARGAHAPYRNLDGFVARHKSLQYEYVVTIELRPTIHTTTPEEKP